jgi:hypothetical protein
VPHDPKDYADSYQENVFPVQSFTSPAIAIEQNVAPPPRLGRPPRQVSTDPAPNSAAPDLPAKPQDAN